MINLGFRGRRSAPSVERTASVSNLLRGVLDNAEAVSYTSVFGSATGLKSCRSGQLGQRGDPEHITHVPEGPGGMADRSRATAALVFNLSGEQSSGTAERELKFNCTKFQGKRPSMSRDRAF